MRPIVVKQYKNNAAFQQDALKQGARGYEIIEVNGMQQRVAITRTAINTMLTGGMGLVIGGRAHKGATVMVTYQYAGKAYANARKAGYLLRIAPVLLLVAIVMAALIVLVLHA